MKRTYGSAIGNRKWGMGVHETNGAEDMKGSNGKTRTSGHAGTNGTTSANRTTGVNGTKSTNGTIGMSDAKVLRNTNGITGTNVSNGSSSVNGIIGTNGTMYTNGISGSTVIRGLNSSNGVDVSKDKSLPSANDSTICVNPRRNLDFSFLKCLSQMIIKEALVEGLHPDSKVVEFRHPRELEKLIDLALEDGASTDEKLLDICQEIIKYSVKSGHENFHNQLFGGLDIHALGGAWLTEALNTSQYTYEVAPVFTLMEKTVFKAMLDLIGFTDGDGIFCPGGSISNMYAVNLARFRKFPEVKTKGLHALPPLCILTSDQSHYSLKKGAAFLGIGMDNVISIKCDQRGKMIPDQLENTIQDVIKRGLTPIMINATAGTTVLGAYDPIGEIADISERYGIWLHVDGAWGGSALLSENYSFLMAGIARADSMSWNPHKMMGAPLQCSAFLTKHKGLMNQCHSAKATYLFQQDKFYDVSFDTGDKSVQCGRKVDVLKLWLMWKAKGNKRFQDDIDNAFDCAKYLATQLENREGFQLVISEPECTNVCFWYIPPSLRGQKHTSGWWTKVGKVAPQIKERMVMEGTCLLGYQPLGDMVNFFRMVVSNLQARRHNMDHVIREIERFGADL